jgi:hypothetical protein
MAMTACREVRHQRGLLVGERAYLWRKMLRAPIVRCPENWDNENSARTSKIDAHKPRIAFDVGLFRSAIGNVH